MWQYCKNGDHRHGQSCRKWRGAAASLDYDLFLAIGSSLTVYPAAGYVLAKKSSAKLVIINHQDTDLDPVADLVIQEGIGEVLSSPLA